MQIYKTTLVLLLLVAGVGAASAQVNIERMRFNAVEDGIGFAAGADFTWRTGTVEHVKFDLTGRFDFDSRVIHVFAVGNGDFGWVDGAPFSNEALAHVREVFRPRHRLQLEFYQQTNYDKARALENRYVLGAGPRFRFAGSERVTLWLGSAYMLEYERLDLPDDALHPSGGTYHRWSNYLSARAELAEGSVLQWTGYLQPRFDDFRDVRTVSDIQLGVRVVGQLLVAVSFFVRYDSEPPDGIRQLDTSFKTGFTFEM